MNSFFERIDLEMIALESAIGAFEAENDITILPTYTALLEINKIKG